MVAITLSAHHPPPKRHHITVHLHDTLNNLPPHYFVKKLFFLPSYFPDNMSPLFSLLVVVALCSAIVSARDRTRDVAAAPSMPSFPLYNAAVDGLRIPALGIGLGGYGFNPAVGYGGYPECFDEFHGCGPYTERAVYTWIKDLGAARLDAANTYGCDPGMGRALKAAKLPRDSLFVLEKIGPGNDTA